MTTRHATSGAATSGAVAVPRKPRLGCGALAGRDGNSGRRLLEGGGTFHRSGSGALSLCHVAAGRLLGYVEVHINSWDCLAGLLLITKAGGCINDFLAGNGLTEGGPVIAGGPRVFPAVAALLGEATPE